MGLTGHTQTINIAPSGENVKKTAEIRQETVEDRTGKEENPPGAWLEWIFCFSESKAAV